MSSSVRVLPLGLLVSGYIRSESENEVPLVLTELCSAYFGNAFHWNFYGKDLENFLSSVNGEVLFSQPFQINNLVFQCCIRPNQYDETQIGFVGFKLLLKSIQHDGHSNKACIKSSSTGDIIIDYELYCHQTESTELDLKYRNKVVYKRRNFHTATYPHHAVPVHAFPASPPPASSPRPNGGGDGSKMHAVSLSEFVADPTIIASYSFYDLMISSDRLKNDKSLCFGCHIGIEKCKKTKKVLKVDKVNGRVAGKRSTRSSRETLRKSKKRKLMS